MTLCVHFRSKNREKKRRMLCNNQVYSCCKIHKRMSVQLEEKSTLSCVFFMLEDVEKVAPEWLRSNGMIQQSMTVDKFHERDKKKTLRRDRENHSWGRRSLRKISFPGGCNRKLNIFFVPSLLVVRFAVNRRDKLDWKTGTISCSRANNPQPKWSIIGNSWWSFHLYFAFLNYFAISIT